MAIIEGTPIIIALGVGALATGGVVAGAARKGRARPRAVAWVTLVAASIAIAGLAAVVVTGGDDEPTLTTNGRSAARAEQLEQQAHLQGQARTHGGSGSTTRSDAGNRALIVEAEELERRAHLDGQARTHGHAEADADTPPGTDEFVPGTRRMPLR
jgi:amino acid transporter